MTGARLRGLHSPDVFDLEHYIPEDEASFGFLLQAMIGPDYSEDAESFDFLVCTPRWLSDHLQTTGAEAIFGRHYLFLSHYTYSILWRTIQQLCERATGNNWGEVGSFLNRYGKWEFEDYIPNVRGV